MFIAWMREDYGIELTLDDVGLRLADQLADRLKHTSGERRLLRWVEWVSEIEVDTDRGGGSRRFRSPKRGHRMA